MKKETIFKILSAAFLVSAGYFFWGGNNDFAFFFLVLSACSFFMNVRFQAKDRLAAHQGSELDDSPTDIK